MRWACGHASRRAAACPASPSVPSTSTGGTSWSPTGAWSAGPSSPTISASMTGTCTGDVLTDAPGSPEPPGGDVEQAGQDDRGAEGQAGRREAVPGLVPEPPVLARGASQVGLR